MLKAILFDFDGVLVDGIPINDLNYVSSFSEIGLDIDLDYLHTKIGMTTGQVIRAILHDNRIDMDPVRLEEKMQENIVEMYAKMAEMPPGLIEFLKIAKSMKLKMGIGSGTHSQAIQKVLSSYGISSYFDVIVGGEMVKRGKPDPELWLRVLEELGVNPSDALAIDDARSGILAAKEINVKAIGYLRYSKEEIPEADENVFDFKEISLAKYLS
jgi:HAD superfamily hydrolase (TIGR01509 family)